MAIATIDTSVRYAGNASASDAYIIPFPFLDSSHIRATTAIAGIPIALGTVIGGNAGTLGGTLYQYAPASGAPALQVGDRIRKVGGDTAYSAGFVLAQGSDRYFEVADQTTIFAVSDEIEIVPRDTGRVLLDPSQYTVTRLEDGSGGALVTAFPVPETSVIRIFRRTPLTQPTEYQPAGPFPAEASETALDRVTMQVQEAVSRIGALEGGGDGLVALPGSGSAIRGIKIWNGPLGRSAVKADYESQLGIERGEEPGLGTLWLAGSLAPGHWLEVRHRAWDQYRVIGAAAAIGELADAYVGTIPASGTIREVIVAVATAGTHDLSVTLSIGGEYGGDYALPANATSVSGAFTLSVAAGDQIRANVTSDYGPPDALGLDIFVVSDRA